MVVDIASRSNGVESGEFSVIHTANSDEIERLMDNPDVNIIMANDFGDTSYTHAQRGPGRQPDPGRHHRRRRRPVPMDPEGVNADSPLLHKSCRQALAWATDNERLAEERGGGLVDVGQRSVPSGFDGLPRRHRLPRVRHRTRPRTLFEQCKTDAGTDVISFRFDTTNDPFNVETNQLVISMWNEAFGDEIEATISPVEQGSYIGLALTGSFQAFRLAQPRRHRPRHRSSCGGSRERRRRSGPWRSTSGASRIR